MPNIEQVPQELYHPLNPYHYLVDNMPLQGILSRIEMVNNAVDIASDQLRDAVGTAGTLNARLSHSLKPDGKLVTASLDEAVHAAGAHSDGLYGGVYYVRYTQDEQAKLANVAEDATNLQIQFDAIPTTVLFDSGVVEVEQSAGVKWNVLPGNKVKANLTFPTTAIHRHYYDQEPLFQGFEPDYVNYRVSSTLVSFVTGTLRVAVNGYLLSQDVEVEVPVGTLATPTLLKFTEAAGAGTFALSEAVTAHDVIRIDFDIILATSGEDTSPVFTSGAQGPPGVQGVQGTQGAFGGPQGTQGVQGVLGTGTQGVQGHVGTTGSQGVQGLQGATGSGGGGGSGSQGTQGPPGVAGSAGPTGPGGPQGSSGNPGPTGPSGSQGSAGPQGNTGLQGPANGPAGPQGSQGTQGAKGNQGNQGLTGTGSPGPQGAGGPPGATGSQGTPGSVGSSGSQGVQGQQGSAGGSGPQGYQGVGGAGGGLTIGAPVGGGVYSCLLFVGNNTTLSQDLIRWDPVNKWFGLNTATPAHPIDVHSTNPPNNFGGNIYMSALYADATRKDQTALNVQALATVNTSFNSNPSVVTGCNVNVTRNQTGSTTLATVQGLTIQTGNLTGTPGATITTTVIGLRITPFKLGGLVTTMFDLFIDGDVGTTGNIVNHYGIYQASTLCENVFFGPIGINGSYTTSPYNVSLMVRANGQRVGMEICTDNNSNPFPLLTFSNASVGRNTPLLQVTYRGDLLCNSGAGNMIATAPSQKIGFYGAAPLPQLGVTGSRGSGAALANLLVTLAAMGLISNQTTA